MQGESNQERLVSVTFPIHKKNEFATLALESILNQSYHEIEVLFLDNSLYGLKDSFNLTDQRIKYFKLSSKFGLADTLNFAIEKAQGVYLARMDYDDIALTDRIEQQVRFMESHPEIGISGANIEVIGSSIDRNVIPGQVAKRKFTHEEITRNLLTNNAFFHPTVIFRLSEIRDKKLKYRSIYDSAEDLDLWCRASRVIKLANLDKTLLQYRIHPSQYSRLDGDSSNYLANKIRIRHAIWLIATKRIDVILGVKICLKLAYEMLELLSKKKKSKFTKFS